jgi:hypothetical protein
MMNAPNQPSNRFKILLARIVINNVEIALFPLQTVPPVSKKNTYIKI